MRTVLALTWAAAVNVRLKGRRARQGKDKLPLGLFVKRVVCSNGFRVVRSH